MVKFIICLLVTLFSFLSGNELYRNEKLSVNSVKELKDIVGDIIICVNYLSLDVFDICNRVFVERKYIDCQNFKKIASGEFPKLWQNACFTSLNNIKTEDINAFCEIGNVLGSCDSESQIKKLTQIENALEKSYLIKNKKLEETKKLYHIVGFSIGLVTCLVVA